MSLKIAFVFPSRERPAKFFLALDNIRELTESKDDYFVWAKLDENDLFADMYRNRLEEYPELTVRWGHSNNKINAVNRSLEDLPDCDIIIVQSDDMIWEMWGFDNEIRNSFAEHFPNLDGVLHYPDSHALDRTMTLTIMGINLYKQLGYLYYPKYNSVYADNDLTEMTRGMGKYVFVSKRIFDHHHPIWRMADWDEQYRRTEAPETYKKDRDVFSKRKAENFGL